MPNWTYNKIVMRDKASLDAVLECMKSDESDFDFNRIVEEPANLRKVNSCGTEWNAIQMANAICRDLGHAALSFTEVARWFEDNYPNITITKTSRAGSIWSIMDPAWSISTDEIKNIADMSVRGNWSKPTNLMSEDDCRILIDNRVRYGTTSWYDWRLNNWGCKWNADNISINKDELSISFITPWSPVPDLMSTMSEKFGVELYYMYDEEQITCCCGEMWFDRGICVIDGSMDDEFDFDMFCVAAELNDYQQDSMRWNANVGEVAFDNNWDDDADTTLFDSLPVMSDLNTAMRNDFLANAKPADCE